MGDFLTNRQCLADSFILLLMRQYIAKKKIREILTCPYSRSEFVPSIYWRSNFSSRSGSPSRSGLPGRSGFPIVPVFRLFWLFSSRSGHSNQQKIKKFEAHRTLYPHCLFVTNRLLKLAVTSGNGNRMSK